MNQVHYNHPQTKTLCRLSSFFLRQHIPTCHRWTRHVTFEWWLVQSLTRVLRLRNLRIDGQKNTWKKTNTFCGPSYFYLYVEANYWSTCKQFSKGIPFVRFVSSCLCPAKDFRISWYIADLTKRRDGIRNLHLIIIIIIKLEI